MAKINELTWTILQNLECWNMQLCITKRFHI